MNLTQPQGRPGYDVWREPRGVGAPRVDEYRAGFFKGGKMKRTAAVLLMIVGLSGCASDPGFNDRVKAALGQTTQAGFAYANQPVVQPTMGKDWYRQQRQEQQRQQELEYQRQQAEALRKISNGY